MSLETMSNPAPADLAAAARSLDLDEMERVARAATFGPWSWCKHGTEAMNNEEWFVVSDLSGVNDGDSLICTTNLLDERDAAHIATFNPAAALALIHLAKTARVMAVRQSAPDQPETLGPVAAQDGREGEQ